MAGPDVDFVKAFQLDSTASETLAAHRFCKQVGEQSVIMCTVAGEQAVGVAETPVTTAERDSGNSGGKTTSVVMEGIVLVEAGTGGLSINQQVMTDADGKAVLATTGLYILGIARKAGAAGDWVPVELVDPVAKV